MCVPPSARGIFVAVICAFPLAHVVYFVAVFFRDMCDPPSACGIVWRSHTLSETGEGLVQASRDRKATVEPHARQNQY